MFNWKAKSLKTKLSLWYVASLLIVISYFLVFIHFYTFPYATQILVLLFIVLTIAQFIGVYRITKSITNLSSKIKQISSENLDEKVTDIGGEDEIGELANSFNNLLNRLHEAFKREQQFIGDVAHELKTPLATLRSTFEIALNKPRENGEYKKVLEEALIETDQINQTLKNVLDLAWVEAPNKRMEKKKFNLKELVSEVSEIAQKMAASKHIKVTMAQAPNISVSGFRDKLARVLLNLIDNSIKYSNAYGKIEIILEKSPTKTLISIIDNGMGIPEEDLPHIFDRFYRGAKTDDITGSGLGLAIAKSIVNLHQGEIRVKSAKSKGSSFIIILPRD